MDARDSGLVADLVPLAGGYSGETFLAEAAGERSVVRIYAGRSVARGPNAAEVDAAVLRLVRGLLPVPPVREVRRADSSAGTPALLVTGWLPGTRLDELLPTADDSLAETVGRNLGRILARLAQIPMLRAGTFLDGELRLGPMPPGADDLATWVERHSEGGPLAEWADDERRGLLAVADRAQDLLDLADRVCLVHSDVNPKNLLVDPATGAVRGLVDWEFAHAGSPYTDLGTLLRFERRPCFADAVLATYAELVVDAPADLLDRARAADLWALVDLASRRDTHDVARRAHDQLRAIARTGDLHAQPVEHPRRGPGPGACG